MTIELRTDFVPSISVYVLMDGILYVYSTGSTVDHPVSFLTS